MGGFIVVSPEARLAQIVTELIKAGNACLVMGGHAVRYYGVGRNTVDYDLHIAPTRWNDLTTTVATLHPLAGAEVREGPSWRPNDFRRFEIGTLPDGREEWLEFWRSNHLLPPFDDLWKRREIGVYGGGQLPFLSLPDLIRSKETERNDDWQDISLLEEVLDQRLFSQAIGGTIPVVDALANVRSRRGFERWLASGRLADSRLVDQAMQQTQQVVSIAFLMPLASEEAAQMRSPTLEPVIARRLRAVESGTRMHFGLVDAVRRRSKTDAQARDRADKESAVRSKNSRL